MKNTSTIAAYLWLQDMLLLFITVEILLAKVKTFSAPTDPAGIQLLFKTDGRFSLTSHSSTFTMTCAKWYRALRGSPLLYV